MARRKNTNSTGTVGGVKNNLTTGFISKIKWGESYTSLILGIFVVVIAAILIVSFAKNIGSGNKTVSQQTLSQKTETTKENTDTLKTYTVGAGDDLWNISEKVYKSGFYWVDIARANNLSDPGLIHGGNVLKLPDVKPLIALTEVTNTEAQPEAISQTNLISGSTYIIQKGDFLWDIAVRAYGDGFKWTDIAKENNLTNPNLIFSENILKIPR